MSQCQCVTAKGTQCSRTAKSPTKYCYQHQDCQKPISSTSTSASASASASSSTAIKKPSSPKVKKPSPSKSKEDSEWDRFLLLTSLQPAESQIKRINTVLKKLNDFVDEHNLETHWISAPALKDYILTMKDLKNAQNVIAPQSYERIEIFKEDPTYFYEYNGDAVTGSGADQWLMFKEGLAEALEKAYSQMQKYAE